MNANSIKIAAAAGVAAVVGLGSVTRVWLTDTEEPNAKMALYQAKCHTLHASVMTELAKRGHYFKAGEALRPSWVAKIYAAQGKGSANSAHIQSLAWDMFRVMPDGTYSGNYEDYVLYGETWKAAGRQVGIEANWGGDFKTLVDAVHTSCTTPQGIK